jgi:Tol biopolymer transport system component
MAIPALSRIGPYEILERVGSGGMGDVYRARDTRLDRIVAIKISKETFSDRVEREARAAAALNHPHICALYDVGPNYLVMEFLEGVPLSGPLPLDRALTYGVQICQALEAAHKKGLTHRDLKPANIMVTKSGGVKLLDFGLAKLQPAFVGSEAATMALTGVGQIAGTLNYMSPEQVQGQEMGPTSDIFSFGLVLYELITGKRAFEGNPASVIAAILERPAPSVADVAPAALDRALNRCLEKDPENRWQSARDLSAELEWIASQKGELVTTIGTPAGVGRSSANRIAWTLAAIMSVIAIGSAYRTFSARRPDPTRKLSMSILTDRPAIVIGGFALSPDGRHLAFIGADETGTQGGEIWVRDFDSPNARGFRSTAGRPSAPFWSPDGRWIGYNDNGILKRVAMTGGPAFEIINATGLYLLGASWGANDTIVFSTARGVIRVPASGGTPVVVVTQGTGATFPSFLPDRRHFTFGSLDKKGSAGLFVGDLNATDPPANARPILVPGPLQAEYSRGHLLFVRNRTVLAQPFDLTRLQISGDAVVVAEGVDTPLPNSLFTASESGALVYTSGATGRTQFTWFDRSGKPMGTIANLGGSEGRSGALSPDGATIALDHPAPPSDSDVWLYDIRRGTESRLTSGPVFNAMSIWSPDGTRIAYWAFRNGIGEIIERNLRTGQERMLPLVDVPSIRDRYPSDWSRDGRYIVIGVAAEKTKIDLWALPVGGDQKAFRYLASEFTEFGAKISPDSRWAAYVSDETGRYEVYVQSFPNPGGKVRISTEGGLAPLWSRDGKELYFVSIGDLKQTLMAVPVAIGGQTFVAGQPKPLFPVQFQLDVPGFAYDVAKDGRFLIPVVQNDRVPFTVVINWDAGLGNR